MTHVAVIGIESKARCFFIGNQYPQTKCMEYDRLATEQTFTRVTDITK